LPRGTDFQDALLELMAAELPATEIARRLRADPRAAPFACYIDSFDRRCVEMTAFLMRAWGGRGT
jgi:hypothetical protein